MNVEQLSERVIRRPDGHYELCIDSAEMDRLRKNTSIGQWLDCVRSLTTISNVPDDAVVYYEGIIVRCAKRELQEHTLARLAAILTE